MFGRDQTVCRTAIIAAVAVALLTACGGSPTSSEFDGSRTATASAAPNHGGALGVGSVEQCMKTYDCPRTLVRRVLAEERSFAHCMRSRGVPTWPGPTIDSRGRPVFAVSISKNGFNPYSAPVWGKTNECSHLMPDLPGAPFQVSR